MILFTEPVLRNKIYSYLTLRNRFILCLAISTNAESENIQNTILLDLIHVVSNFRVHKLESTNRIENYLRLEHYRDFIDWTAKGAMIDDINRYMPFVDLTKRNIAALIFYYLNRTTRKYCGVLIDGSFFYATEEKDISYRLSHRCIYVAPNLTYLFKELQPDILGEVLSSNELSSEEIELIISANNFLSNASESIMMMFESHFYNRTEEVESYLKQLMYERAPISDSTPSSYIN